MRVYLGLLLFVALVAPGVAGAQPPRIAALFPCGGQRGVTVTLSLEGAGLDQAERVLVDGTGVAARLEPPVTASGDEKEPRPRSVSVAIDSDAAPGLRELRVTGPTGTSNPAYFTVGLWPEIVETEPNDDPGTAPALPSLPVTINGRLRDEADVDCFPFTAGAGETLVMDAAAGLIRSPADLQLELLDAKGNAIARVIERGGRDPRLIHRFERAGRYVARVRDVTYRSGQGFTYRLTLGRLPVVTRYMPRGGQAGTRVAVRVEGANLGDLRELEVPLRAPGSQLPAPRAEPGAGSREPGAGSAQRSELALVPETPNGPALPITLLVGDEVEALETEPNDTRASATRVSALPVVLNGAISRPGDVDLFRLRLTARQTVLFDLVADRIGARLDASLRLIDSSGRTVATNDDAIGVDPQIEFAAPSEGDYLLEVRAADGRGDPDAYYRLRVAPAPGPGFSLTVAPGSPNVGRGGAARLIVRARRSGFTGPIALRAEGLPPGVAASQAVMRVGRDVAYLTLSAADDAPLGIEELTVVGAAEIDGRAVQRFAVAMEGVPSGGARRPEIPAAFRIATVTKAPPLTLRVEPAHVTLKPGEKVKVLVRARREPGVKESEGRWSLRATEMPEGVSAQLKPIEEGQNEVEIEITAAETASAAVESVVLFTERDDREYCAPAVTIEVVANR
jgi:hypothetical protein